MKGRLLASATGILLLEFLTSAQTPASGNPAKLSFDVASVKANNSGTVNTFYQRMPGGLTYINVALVRLIQGAYAIQDL